MNEVLAPLFYVFRNDPNEENAVSDALMLDYICISYVLQIITLETYQLCDQRFPEYVESNALNSVMLQLYHC